MRHLFAGRQRWVGRFSCKSFFLKVRKLIYGQKMLFWTCLFVPFTSQAQLKMEQEFSVETVHPVARRLLPEEQWYDPLDEAGPFGSDQGHDLRTMFFEWRPSNPESSTLQFVESWVESSGLGNAPDAIDPRPMIDQMLLQSPKTIEDYAAKNNLNYTEAKEEFYSKMIQMFGKGPDFKQYIREAYFQVAFIQLVFEGKVDPDLKHKAIESLTIEAEKDNLNKWGESQDYRLERIQAMMRVLRML